MGVKAHLSYIINIMTADHLTTQRAKGKTSKIQNVRHTGHLLNWLTEFGDLCDA